ncbi:3-phosphoshikimate 1-carboxyvinyltransferase [Methanohalophilus mahii]|uniref:3-phosphoshikimate 1-carboxyvinyltransferase n=1 Tax=Methanohalophilus mahii (strain ATCC 35705 / DSM 5219 / SLP) TaxID=547558 RepID=D5EAA3_METMS|nr:3-phosphoshikimate 1-carboxyvinyltransferase [Methanohalophilus mahii]ADE36104.1 3-phosphoshikimate 1-carboxyvinyltransferase [Methanohalophilus mahii DSM 5219]
MRVKISRTSVEGEVFAPPSKSYTHRAITIGSLSEKCVVRRPLISEDTKATIHACKMLGAQINEEKGDLFIEGVKGKPHIPEDVIDVGNSGTTLRFMTAVASLVDGVSILTGDNSLRTRPNGPLIEVLHDLGVEVISTLNNGCAPLVVKGGLKGAIAKIDGSISSQFISALLIACPLTSKSTTLSIKGELRSKPYVNVTLEILREAGAEIFEDSNHNIKFIIPPNQDYNLRDYLVPGDFSSASYLLAAAAMTGSRVVVKNMFPSQQGDMAIIGILKQMGAGISWDKDNGRVTVNGRDLKGVRVDAAATPDLVPTIAVLGAVAEGQTVIENAEHVRYKETDRLHAMAVELKKMGVSVKEDQDKLTIKGGKLKGSELHGWHDHRIVMALTIAGMVAGDTTVDTAESIFISYPNFFDDVRSLGADVVVNKQ